MRLQSFGSFWFSGSSLVCGGRIFETEASWDGCFSSAQASTQLGSSVALVVVFFLCGRCDWGVVGSGGDVYHLLLLKSLSSQKGSIVFSLSSSSLAWLRPRSDSSQSTSSSHVSRSSLQGIRSVLLLCHHREVSFLGRLLRCLLRGRHQFLSYRPPISLLVWSMAVCPSTGSLGGTEARLYGCWRCWDGFTSPVCLNFSTSSVPVPLPCSSPIIGGILSWEN